MRKYIAVLLAVSALFGMSACVQPKEDSGAYDNAMAALNAGNYELAMTEFEKAYETDGREAESCRGQGIVYYKQGSYEAAVLMFDKSLEALKYDNKEFREDVLFYKADSYVKSNDDVKGLEIYSELESGEKAYLALAHEGCIYLRNGNTGKADECFKASLEKGKSIDACLMIYEEYKNASLEGDGVKYLEEAKTIIPETAQDHAMLGKVYDYLEDYDNAVSQLNIAIEKGYTGAMNILGNIYLGRNDVSGAKSLFLGALDKNVDPAMAYNGLAMCAICEGNYDSAVTYTAMGLECGDPNAARDLLFNEIVAYEKKLDFETAMIKAESYLKIYPEDETMRREFKFLSHGGR